mmetsp:Transcript_13095/g.19619  ORF Transcript_13095/g.19619 Transcript_13095/m.19619 type:complete len:442 (+) Transcript_13095:105-1430(+)
MLDQCSELCGWTSGFIAALSFGSFGVPIKLISNVKVDPLVMQTYKSTVCFLTCWLVIPLGEPFKFTPWGIVSGIFWVPGATAGIYGIRNAGLAISVGTWSSLVVVSSFSWGIFVFNEKVKSIAGASGAAIVLICGLIGMSIFSAPVKNDISTSSKLKTEDLRDDEDGTTPLLTEQRNSGSSYRGSDSEKSIDSEDEDRGSIELREIDSSDNNANSSTPIPRPGRITRRKKIVGVKKLRSNEMEEKTSTEIDINNKIDEDKEDDFNLFGGKVRLSRRQLGILGAVVNGVWGGNNMIPMHYASKQGFHGAGYLISYSCGSMLVTILMWVCRYLYNLYCWDFDGIQAYNALPSFHFREMWLAGLIAGGLYSLGNLCSILAVTSLGQGVGYSFVQLALLVSGVWGIFFFGEVQGFDRIWKWILSSMVTVTGILWLSYEHEGAVGH